MTKNSHNFFENHFLQNKSSPEIVKCIFTSFGQPTVTNNDFFIVKNAKIQKKNKIVIFLSLLMQILHDL